MQLTNFEFAITILDAVLNKLNMQTYIGEIQQLYVDDVLYTNRAGNLPIIHVMPNGDNVCVRFYNRDMKYLNDIYIDINDPDMIDKMVNAVWQSIETNQC